MGALPISDFVITESLYMLRATHWYVAWSDGSKCLISISLMTSSVVTLLMALMLALFLYHVILGRGDPLAEQLTRMEALMLGTVIEAGGVEVKTGDSE